MTAQLSFLFDAALVPDLAEYARSRGHAADIFDWRTLDGALDHALVDAPVAGEHIFVTTDPSIFRALILTRPSHRGSIAWFPEVAGHRQIGFLMALLDRISSLETWTGKVFEVGADAHVVVSDFPPG